jgi:hypothetical protein
MNTLPFPSRVFARCCVILLGIVTPYAAQANCEVPFIRGLANSCEVVPKVLWRGAKPDMDAAAQLLERGVKTIVNFEIMHDDKTTLAASRPDLRIPYNLSYYTLPDWEPLVLISHKHVDKRVESFIAIARTAPLPLFVHCRSGQNRTGVMVAALRIFDGMPIDLAVDEMASYGGLWSKPDAQYLRTLTPAKRAKMEKNIAKKMQQIKPDAVLTCSSTGCADLTEP